MYNAMNHDPAMKHIKDLKSLIREDLYDYLDSHKEDLNKDLITTYVEIFADVIRLEERLKDLPNARK